MRTLGIVGIVGVFGLAALGMAACSGAETEHTRGGDDSGIRVRPDATTSVEDAGGDVDDPADAGDADAATDAGYDAGLEFDCGAAAADAGDGGKKKDAGADGGVPHDLACTGLYSNWPSHTIAPSARAYKPGVELWSDGAEKSRWVMLPPSTQIDTTNMNEWTFPVGTKIWKEFRLSGTPIETRLLWKRTASDWVRTTYRWSADGKNATELTTGELDVNGTGYEVPSQAACGTCHQGRLDDVLGFEAVGLSMSGATGLEMTQLVSESLLTNPPTSPIVVPGNATEKAALSWLHANCGNICHNRSPYAYAGSTGLWMRLEVERMATVKSTDTIQTAVNVVSGFQTSPTSKYYRIKPGNAGQSAIPFRAGYRDTTGEGFQMPPIDSHAVDTTDVAVLKSWINAM